MSFGKLILEAGSELNEALRQCRVSVEAAQKLREPLCNKASEEGEVEVFKRRAKLYRYAFWYARIACSLK